MDFRFNCFSMDRNPGKEKGYSWGLLKMGFIERCSHVWVFTKTVASNKRDF